MSREHRLTGEALLEEVVRRIAQTIRVVERAHTPTYEAGPNGKPKLRDVWVMDVARNATAALIDILED